MTTETFTLFCAVLLLGMFSLYINLRAGSNFVKATTLICVWLAIAFMFTIIIKSFMGL